ncbi:MAG TPA: hypothetical protein VM103_01450, partial [Candidatus Paceibacterota bacterium]|nr:hypothetical protein [Candidatus Paceibacterota bacterium]
SSGGGGGGGGHHHDDTPTVSLFATPHPSQPLAYLYLSQIPYTGLDLGPLGTALYWIALIGWSLALAYLVLFGALPLAARRVKSFGERVTEVLNAHEYAVATVPPAPVSTSVQFAPEPVMPTYEFAPEAPRGYSSYDGFKSFAEGRSLSIEDIVKGLARNSVPRPEPAAQPAYMPEPVMMQEAMPKRSEPEPARARMEQSAPAAVPGSGVAPHVRGFIASLVERDRESVFSALRNHVKGGGDAEQFLTHATCAIDDAYRARVDGSACDPEVARICASCDTPALERIIAALTNAIDSSYSTGVTGAKLALTRALATLGA